MKRRRWSFAEQTEDEVSPTAEGWSVAGKLKHHQRRAEASPIGELKRHDGELKRLEQRSKASRQRAKASWQWSGLLKRYERRSKAPWQQAKAPQRRSGLLKHCKWRFKAPRRSGLLNCLRNMWGKERIKWEKWKRKKGLSVFSVILLVTTCVSSL